LFQTFNSVTSLARWLDEQFPKPFAAQPGGEGGGGALEPGAEEQGGAAPF
jgi:hypothetical protein